MPLRSSLTWVVIGYLLVVTVLAAQLGQLGGMLGRVRMYEAGFGVFVAGPVLCALSWDAWPAAASSTRLTAPR